MKLALKNNLRHHKRPFLIAGPCSVENEQQMTEVAQSLAVEHKPALLRGGIWKPRTRPNSFEGVGEEGLKWLVEAGRNIQVPVTTEVANAKHVEQALSAGVDVLWIGARTTVNPFAVQEIADALKGVDITIFVKNPINPDFMLWIGAFERLQKSGIDDLAAIHRGFSVYQHKKYRNVPTWEIPIALLEEAPEIPIITDPSHIVGNRNGLYEVAQKAMDLNFAGLMIETHSHPDKALSDAQQQITPKQLKTLINQLVLRSETVGIKQLSSLEKQREKIAVLDDKLFEMLAERMQIALEIGDFKREHEVTILQAEHWRKMLENRLKDSENSNLTPSFVRAVLDAIHQESIRHQTKVMNPNK